MQAKGPHKPKGMIGESSKIIAQACYNASLIVNSMSIEESSILRFCGLRVKRGGTVVLKSLQHGMKRTTESKVFAAELLDFKVATPSPKASVQSCEQQTTCSTNIVINPDQLVDVLKVKLISWQWSKAIWYNRTFNKMSKNPLPPVSVPGHPRHGPRLWSRRKSPIAVLQHDL